MKKIIFTKNQEHILSLTLIVSAIFIYLLFLIPANTDLTSGVHELFMDERISFDAIHEILHLKNKSNFLDAVIVGQDQRYGNVIYNMSAIVAFVPERIWGATGQIIAVRMLIFILLITSYLILIKVCIKKSIYGAFAFISLLCIPTTAYYATMPKPEPFLLFFLSIFLTSYLKNGFRFGWHFIWLGLAFGCKISLLFPLLFIMIISIITEIDKNNIDLFSKKKSSNQYWLFFKKCSYGIFSFAAGLSLAVPSLLLAFRHLIYLRIYLGATFGNTGHGSDDTSVTIITWLKNIFTVWIPAPLSILIGVVLIALTIIIRGLILEYYERKDAFYRRPLFLISAIGFLLLLPILLLTKRIWFFYLHSGIIFMVIAFFAAIIKVAIKSRVTYYYSRFATIVILIFSVTYLFGQQRRELKSLSKRTTEPFYLLQKERYLYYTSLLINEKKIFPEKTITAIAHPIFFRYDNKDTPVELFWGYFTSWGEGKTFIFLPYNPKLLLPPRTTNKEFGQFQICMSEYKKHVGDSAISPTYILLPQKVEGLFAFKLVR